jgi:chromosome segregation ATPase
MRGPAALESDVTYHYERPDQKAISDLEQLLHNLAEELAGWRRRTLKAEGELQEMRANGGVLAGPELNQSRQRVIELEMENQALRQRIDGAKDRLKTLASRLTFLEQHGGGNAA